MRESLKKDRKVDREFTLGKMEILIEVNFREITEMDSEFMSGGNKASIEDSGRMTE